MIADWRSYYKEHCMSVDEAMARMDKITEEVNANYAVMQ